MNEAFEATLDSPSQAGKPTPHSDLVVREMFIQSKYRDHNFLDPKKYRPAGSSVDSRIFEGLSQEDLFSASNLSYLEFSCSMEPSGSTEDPTENSIHETLEDDSIYSDTSQHKRAAATHDSEDIGNLSVQAGRNSMSRGSSSRRSTVMPSRKGGGTQHLTSIPKDNLVEPLRDKSASRERRSRRPGNVIGLSEETDADDIPSSCSTRPLSQRSSSASGTIRRSTRGEIEQTAKGEVHAAKSIKKSSSFSGPCRSDSSSRRANSRDRAMRRSPKSDVDPDKTERSSSAPRSRRQVRGLESGGLSTSGSTAAFDRQGNGTEGVLKSSRSPGGYKEEGTRIRRATSATTAVNMSTNKSQPLRRAGSGAKLAIEVAAHLTSGRRAGAGMLHSASGPSLSSFGSERRSRISKKAEYEENMANKSFSLTSQECAQNRSKEQKLHSAKVIASTYSTEDYELGRNEKHQSLQRNSEPSCRTRSKGRRNDAVSSRGDLGAISRYQSTLHHSPPPPDSQSQDISPSHLRAPKTRLRWSDTLDSESKNQATCIGLVARNPRDDESVSPAPRLPSATGRRTMMRKAYSVSALDPNHHGSQAGHNISPHFKAAAFPLLAGDISNKTNDGAMEENDLVALKAKPAKLSAEA